MNRCQKSIAAPGHSFDKRWIFCRVAQSIAQPADRGVQAVIKIDKGVRRPKLLLQFIADNDLTRSFDQSKQYLERLFLQPYPRTVATKFPRPQIHFERTKADRRQLVRTGYRHCHPASITDSNTLRLDSAKSPKLLSFRRYAAYLVTHI